MTEHRWIASSALAALALAAMGVIWGLAARATVILFDGVTALLGVAVSGLAILAARQSSKEPDDRYPFGREGTVPLVVGLQGALLLGSCVFAILSAVQTILAGGSIPDPRSGLIYALVNAVAVLGVALWLRRGRATSDLVSAEASAWMAAAPQALGILVGFGLIFTLDRRGGLPAVVPYIDSTMVLLACLLVVPTAVRLIRVALDQLLERAADEPTQQPIRAALQQILDQWGLGDPTVRISRLGHKLYVEIDVLDPTGRITTAEIDLARRRLVRQLAVPGRRLWLNLELHVDPDWDS